MSLTREGKARLRACQRAIRKMESELFPQLSALELAQLRTLLTTMTRRPST